MSFSSPEVQTVLRNVQTLAEVGMLRNGMPLPEPYVFQLLEETEKLQKDFKILTPQRVGHFVRNVTNTLLENKVDMSQFTYSLSLIEALICILKKSDDIIAQYESLRLLSLIPSIKTFGHVLCLSWFKNHPKTQFAFGHLKYPLLRQECRQLLLTLNEEFGTRIKSIPCIFIQVDGNSGLIAPSPDKLTEVIWLDVDYSKKEFVIAFPSTDDSLCGIEFVRLPVERIASYELTSVSNWVGKCWQLKLVTKESRFLEVALKPCEDTTYLVEVGLNELFSS